MYKYQSPLFWILDPPYHHQLNKFTQYLLEVSLQNINTLLDIECAVGKKKLRYKRYLQLYLQSTNDSDVLQCVISVIEVPFRI